MGLPPSPVTAGPLLHLPTLWTIFRGEMFNLVSDAPCPWGTHRIFINIISAQHPLHAYSFSQLKGSAAQIKSVCWQWSFTLSIEEKYSWGKQMFLSRLCSVIKYKFAKLNFINKLNNREFCFFVNLLAIKRMEIWFTPEPWSLLWSKPPLY